MNLEIARHMVDLTATVPSKPAGGTVAPPVPLEDVFAGLLESGARRMTIYFDSGLTSRDAALDLIQRLHPDLGENCYSYPVFMLWGNDVAERIETAMLDVIESSPLFMRVLKHVMRSVSRLLVQAQVGPPDSAPLLRARRAIEEERLFSADPASLTVLDALITPAVQSLTDKDVGGLQAALAADAQADRALRAMMAAISRRGLRRTTGPQDIAGQSLDGSATGYLSRAILTWLASGKSGSKVEDRARRATGAADWFFAGDVLCSVVQRVQDRTDHGFLPTILEEMYRTMYADKVGRFLWDAVKAEAASAFTSQPAPHDGAIPGGARFLQLLDAYQAQHGAVELNLIAYSAGSIPLAYFVHSGVNVVSKRFSLRNVALLAPACSFDLFAANVALHQERIGALRIFTMSDARERSDAVVKLMPIAYPSSLLYLVSGLFEDQPDTPLVGLARHLQSTTLARSAEMRLFLEQFDPPAVVYAPTGEDAAAGQSAHFTNHFGEGGPVNDRATLDSIAFLIRPAAATELQEFSAGGVDVASFLTQMDKATELRGAPAAGANEDLPKQIIGTNDIVDHALVASLVRAGRPVARVVTKGVEKLYAVEPQKRSAAWAKAEKAGSLITGYGTGWILGAARRVLITNNHVLPLAEAAKTASVEFGFERDSPLREAEAKLVVTLQPEELFITDPNMQFGGLDYTVVALSRQAPEEWGFLEPQQGTTASGARNIFIVQHPHGGGKSYVLTNNRKLKQDDRYVAYASDTLQGSSGSALFNDSIKLVGIHHLGDTIPQAGGEKEPVNIGSRIEVVIADFVRKLHGLPGWDENKVLYWFGEGFVLDTWRRLADE